LHESIAVKRIDDAVMAAAENPDQVVVVKIGEAEFRGAAIERPGIGRQSIVRATARPFRPPAANPPVLFY